MGSGETAALYDDIGVGYDATRRSDPYRSDRLAHHLKISGQRRYLDLACGTGNYTAALATRGGQWYGLDQSQHMIRAAREKSREVVWHQGDVAVQPFNDWIFAGVSCSCAIHHFNELHPVFREVYRVIDRGRFVIFTATPEQMSGYWLNHYFPDAMLMSIQQMPSLDLVQTALTEAGFQIALTEPYEVQPDLADFFLYSGKHHPEMYLSGGIRRGISTFASLAEPSEVVEGCARLRADIASGRIADVMRGYRSREGDYLFVIASKGA